MTGMAAFCTARAALVIAGRAMLHAMTDPELLTFPCDYPIKVMLRAGAELRTHVDAVMARHSGPAVIESATTRPSAQGNFSAVTYTIRARDAGADRRAVRRPEGYSGRADGAVALVRG